MSTASIQVGDVVAQKYRIEGVIGEGAMGLVVSAMHIGLQQRVAIKFLQADIAERESSAERFRREALAAASIRGEHACRVLDVGTHENGVPYIVMEHLDGQTLGHELKERGPLPYREAVSYVLEACEALAEAHVLGIVHRDVKPANLFLAESVGGTRTLKVLDFGVAKSLAHGTPGAAALTKTASFVGSPLYISPEQLHSVKDLDARSDVWSLGVVLYELIAGRAPFMGESIAELIACILYKEPASLLTSKLDLPYELTLVIHRALAKQREDRYASVGELADALAAVLDDDESVASAERTHRVLSGHYSRRDGRGMLQEPQPSIERPTTARRTSLRGGRAASMVPKDLSVSTARPRRRALLATLMALLLLGGAAYLMMQRSLTVERANAPAARVEAVTPSSLPPRSEPPLAEAPAVQGPTPIVPEPAAVAPAEPAAAAQRSAARHAAEAAEPTRPVLPTAIRRAASVKPAPSSPPPAAATSEDALHERVRLRDYGGRR
ncbi:MAG: Protein kinase [Myxococcaceae bacterium]|nr:Protein kinase [Myxococcaceae bacterium]